MPQEPGCGGVTDPADDAIGPALDVVDGCPPFCLDSYTCIDGGGRAPIDWGTAELYFNMYFAGLTIDPIPESQPMGSAPEDIRRISLRVPVGFERVAVGDVVSTFPRNGELMEVEEVWEDRTIVFLRGAFGTELAESPANTMLMFFRVFQGPMIVGTDGRACYHWLPSDIRVPGQYIGYVDALVGDQRIRLPLKGTGYLINIVPPKPK